MARRCWLFVGILGMLMLASCQRAQQYPTAAKKTNSAIKEKTDEERDRGPVLAWLEPSERRDMPMIFVAEDSEEWKRLPGFWSASPIGMPTLHFGIEPLAALAALESTEQELAIKIKVPRGLPDPTPNFPPSNRPSFGKWQLGKELFFEAVLPTATGRKVCASCHNPQYAYSDDRPRPGEREYNTLSLVNAVYNHQQFWDGRVRTLEETLGGFSTKSEAGKSKERDPHDWSGLVKDLVDSKKYDARFNRVFGVEHPTQDTVAQALATYLRTLLSGDSLYDRLGLSDLRFQPKELSTAKIVEVLGDKSIAAHFVERDKARSAEDIASMVARGHSLFYGQARCAECHSGPLLTDHDYHNIGIDAPDIGVESGRALHVPVGLKEARLIGAFRTPTLRNLLKSAPYFHDGKQVTLLEVVDYFDHGVQEAPNRLARPLLDGPRPRRLNLSAHDKESLVMFLRALEGTPTDPIVTGIAR